MRAVRRIGFPGAAIVLVAAALAAPSPAAAAPAPLAQFGSMGPAAGELFSPFGVAVDGSGRVYVADGINSRISVYDAAGGFIHAFGYGVDTGANAFEVCTTASGCQVGFSGGAAGQLNFPISVALDGKGSLYVLEFSGRRISVFDPAGPSFVRALGFGVDTGAAAFEVCTAASGCQGSPSGSGPGQLESPFGLALDASGNLYVGDRDNQRVSVFNSTPPAFVHAFGWDVAEPDTGGSFEVCPADGACRIGDEGGGPGQFSFPTGQAHDGANTLYVTEGSRISVFNTAVPSFVRAFGTDVAEPDGGNDFEVCPADGACRMADFGGAAGQLSSPTGIGRAGSGDLYVSEQGGNRVSLFDPATPSFTLALGWGVDTGADAFEVCTAISTCQTATGGAGAGQLSSPNAVAVDCRGGIYVVDTANNRLQRFGEPGTALPPCPTTSTPEPVTTPEKKKAKKRKCKKRKRGKGKQAASAKKRKCKRKRKRN